MDAKNVVMILFYQFRINKGDKGEGNKGNGNKGKGNKYKKDDDLFLKSSS